MKKVVFLTIILTLVAVFGGYHVIKATGEYPFCGSCHEWDGAIAQTNLADPIHGGSNPKGLGAKCTDCHLPHDSLANYIFTKAKNGIAEGITTLTGDPDKKDWIANREYARKNYTFDSSCLNCHADIVKTSDANATRQILPVNSLPEEIATLSEAGRMHMKYLEFKGTGDEMKCTDCHKNVGHKELGKMLIEQKHRIANSWDEWENMYQESRKNK
ncbi:NapC/NirT family cytochrome c [Campylobacter sp. RM9344]|uniref:Cytochrome c-type protein n=1 Tax=Campylobacter californiensis TaxID=1032243 RepID=A0AAW3ZUH6_9BACT|nr:MULTISPECIES: NapC/NirT family cytochrome c [unclassified Campylobacter]MBE2985381.1 NapC/NirT family cytochrome c [Campylobacter sp. RM6883]MBE2995961.1 NapC/NirT family cytochrome c [Campylobacter sp. RM6913]MBE3029290.1 NapC/NirT family cytochrome c [Campylobacter sp. RM9344]MBE3608492.1 NapC/NirT family cytochrome c [Campylobacter sp. RM9337]QCD50579.1 NapC/NirT cytochrome c family protein [Campylobacter sp. RM6914]